MVRRTQVQRAVVPRRTRRGFRADVPNNLVVTGAPPGTFTNGVTGSGANVRLQTPQGDFILLAGVVVAVGVTPGGALLTATPATATTDATGTATFTALKLDGTAGTYALTFSAVGYVPATSNGHILQAGAANAARTVADVPDGVVNAPTRVVVSVHDASGNQLAVGGEAVTVAVSGSNTVAQTAAADNGNGTYTYSYTPTNSGTDSLTIRLNGTTIGGSPYASDVTATGSGFRNGYSLRVGMSQLGAELGKGPVVSGGAYQDQEPRWRSAVLSLNAADLNDALDEADAHNILLINAVGAPGQIKDASGLFSQSAYLTQASRFVEPQVSAAMALRFTTAMAQRKLIWQLCDEPWHPNTYSGSFTPAMVRWCARLIKGAVPDGEVGASFAGWPNCIAMGRIEPQYIYGTNSDWPGQTNLPIDYFDKLDYVCATWRGKNRQSGGAQYDTPAAFFSAAKTRATVAKYGLVLATNWADLGDGRCWDAHMVGGTPPPANSRISGSGANAPGTYETCPSTTGTTLWVESPEELDAVIRAAVADDDAPYLNIWAHSEASVVHNLSQYEKRADFSARFQSMIRIGEGRSPVDGFAWRTPK